MLYIRALNAVSRRNSTGVKVAEWDPSTVLKLSLPPSELALGLSECERADEHGNVQAGGREHETKGLSSSQRRSVEACEARLGSVHDVRGACHLEHRRVLERVVAAGACLLGTLRAALELRGDLEMLYALGGLAQAGKSTHSAGRRLCGKALGLTQRYAPHVNSRSHVFSLYCGTINQIVKGLYRHTGRKDAVASGAAEKKGPRFA